MDKLPLGSWAAPGRAASPALLPGLPRLPLLLNAWGERLLFTLSTTAPKENVTVSSSPAQHTSRLGHIRPDTSSTFVDVIHMKAALHKPISWQASQLSLS